MLIEYAVSCDYSLFINGSCSSGFSYDGLTLRVACHVHVWTLTDCAMVMGMSDSQRRCAFPTASSHEFHILSIANRHSQWPVDAKRVE